LFLVLVLVVSIAPTIPLLPRCSGSVAYLTTVGNHESDWPNTASIPDFGLESGGECGVVALALVPMPAPASTNQPWWSYDIGLIHFVGMSTEHDFSVGSPQHRWIEADLAGVNRSLTPWVVFSGHRPMYVDSNYCCGKGTVTDCTACTHGSDVQVMQMLQESVEPLLFQYQVNLAFAGHFHNVQRQSAVYQGYVVQKSQETTDAQGHKVFVHEQPQGTVWMVVGSAGNGPLLTTENYSWSEAYWNYMYGYALLTATNATHLDWKFINSANDDVIDRMVITQSADFAPWTFQVPTDDDDATGGGTQGWNGLSSSAQAGIISVIVLVCVGALLVMGFIWRRKQQQLQSPSQAGTSHANNPPEHSGAVSPLQQQHQQQARSKVELNNLSGVV
jgi:hypothetical protein